MYISDPELFAEYLEKVGQAGEKARADKRVLSEIQSQISIAKSDGLSRIQKSFNLPISDKTEKFFVESGIKVTVTVKGDGPYRFNYLFEF